MLVTRRTFVTLVVTLVALGVTGGAGQSANASLDAVSACSPARMNYPPNPSGDPQLARLPWVRGKPLGVGLVGLIWYWPAEWRDLRVRAARIYTGGRAPAGYSTKILWSFVAPSAVGNGGPRLLVRGSRLDATGTFSARFSAISFSGDRGAPSYASIVNVPEPGCWKLDLSTRSLRASVVILAVDPAR